MSDKFSFRFLAGVLVAAVIVPGPALADWTGPYIGTHIGGHFAGYEITGDFDNAAPTTIGLDSEAFVAGGQIGYNHEFGGLVLGIEAAVSLGEDVDTHQVVAADSADGRDDFANVVFGHTASLAGRLGLPLAGGLMPFVKAGVVWADIEAEAGDTDDSPPVLDGTDRTAVGGWERGYVIGGGVEVLVLTNWSFKAEYEYMDFGSFASGNGDGEIIRHDLDNHAVKLGVSYQF